MQLSRSTKAVFLAAIALLTGFEAAIAQEQQVIAGEYVVSAWSAPVGGAIAASAVTDTSFLDEHQLSITKRLGRNPGGEQMVVRYANPLAAAAVGEGSIVPYDAGKDICPDLIASRAVRACSPNFVVHASAIPNDTKFGNLWGLGSASGIDAPRAWDATTGSNEVVVAVIDTGADYNHQDLAGNIWTNPREIPNNGIDDDHDGVVDDVHGANFSGSGARGNPMDDNNHGTHVSGTIGALGNNNLGVVGINWHVKILPIKFLNGAGSGTTGGAIQAINYMVALKNSGVNIRVANNSWGGSMSVSGTDPLYEAIRAAGNAGIIFVAAAGNDGANNDINPEYPASYDLPNIVSVAAIDQQQKKATFSNYGVSRVDIGAPGVGIWSTTPNNTYASYSGTSMATPHVAGALALLLGSEPNLSAAQAIQRLYDSAVPLDSLAGKVATGRTLNVARMIYNETNPLPPPTPTPPPCHYSMEEIGFSPDTSVGSEPIVLQEDEFNYYSMDLPFSLPYYRDHVSAIDVSPNGVIYTQGAPYGMMDYDNTTHAPLNSIAALQTDLYAAGGTSDGVRVKSSSSKVTVFWNVKSYDYRKEGNVKVWLDLYPNGQIEEFVQFDSPALESAVRKAATIGIAGGTAGMMDTFAVNDSSIRNGLGIRYTPRCDSGGGDTAVVKKVKVVSPRGIDIRPGDRVAVKILGRGYGDVQVSAAFNGQSCGSSKSGYLADGKLRMNASLPKLRFAKFAVSVNGQRASMRVRSSGVQSRSKRLSAKALQNACTKFMGSLH